MVFDADPQTIIQQPPVPEEMLRHAEPEPEQGRGADHVVVGYDPQGRPAVHHGQEREMVVRQGRVGFLAQAEAVEDVVFEQGTVAPFGRVFFAKDLFLRCVDSLSEFVCSTLQHEVVQLRGALGELIDLSMRLGVQDGEAGIDVPFLGVDAQHEVDLDILDPADVAGAFPGELLVGVPCLAHGEEGGVGDGLGVGRDTVMFLGGEIDNFGVQAAEDGFHLGEGGVRGTVLDQDEGLAARVNVGAVEGMT